MPVPVPEFRPPCLAAIVMLCLGATLAACGPVGGAPRLVIGNENEVGIEHTGWLAPDSMADRYCHEYGKRAVYRGFVRIERFADRKLYRYACEYPVQE